MKGGGLQMSGLIGGVLIVGFLLIGWDIFIIRQGLKEANGTLDNIKSLLEDLNNKDITKLL